MAPMRMVQVTIHYIVGVIPMLDRLVTAIRTVRMICVMALTDMGFVLFVAVIVAVIPMRMMQVTIHHIVGVVPMLDRLVTAVRAMLVAI